MNSQTESFMHLCQLNKVYYFITHATYALSTLYSLIMLGADLQYSKQRYYYWNYC